MSLIERFKQDIQTITSNSSEFGQLAVLVSPEADTISVYALATAHHTGFDTDGIRVNSKMASIAVSEQLLIDGLYPYKDGNDEYSFKNHKATFDGIEYVITEWFPDETAGLIILILALYA